MPYIDPQRRFILFQRQEGTTGGLYISRRQADGTWTEAFNITETYPDINGVCPQITPDGRFLFFLRGNVYWVDAQFIFDMIDG
jgi:hypothetical protein